MVFWHHFRLFFWTPPGGSPETILGGFWCHFGLPFGIFSPSFSGPFLGTLFGAFWGPQGGGGMPRRGAGVPGQVFIDISPRIDDFTVCF